jgi:hypothetical protein
VGVLSQQGGLDDAPPVVGHLEMRVLDTPGHTNTLSGPSAMSRLSAGPIAVERLGGCMCKGSVVPAQTVGCTHWYCCVVPGGATDTA